MTEAPNIPSEPEDDETLAAEYVLGVLGESERAAASARVAADPAFAQRVAEWETRLSGMNSEFAEVKPPQSVKRALDERLFGAEVQSSASAPKGVWNSLAFWRLLSGAALAAFAIAVFVALRPPETLQPAESLVASLSAEDSDARFITLYDPAAGTLRVTRLAGEEPADRDFELWIIAGDEPPVSLGVVSEVASGAAVPAPLADNVTEGVTFAVTLEPTGGSPTGAPTGPVVAHGTAHKI